MAAPSTSLIARPQAGSSTDSGHPAGPGRFVQWGAPFAIFFLAATLTFFWASGFPSMQTAAASTSALVAQSSNAVPPAIVTPPVANATREPERPAPQLPVSEHLPAPSTYIAPRALNWSKPDVSDLISEPTDMRVHLNIDASGRVTDAQATMLGAENNEPLRQAVLLAARQWTFKPAQQDGENIAGARTMVFHFTPADSE